MATTRERADEPRGGAIEDTTLAVEVVTPAAVTSLRPAGEHAEITPTHHDRKTCIFKADRSDR
jgi:hypothetical protein